MTEEATARFTTEAFEQMDKEIFIHDKEGIFRIAIDYDDVDHREVKANLPALMSALNALPEPIRLNCESCGLAKHPNMTCEEAEDTGWEGGDE